ncbi:helix-turn-helix domain-containing protein [Bombilactobacillus bombi]|uniref:LexA family transcriptional regulator n=1 Tax=Bombilactobacillus bombi TaxID=1303590 RepID=UPI000E56AB2A|nr:LexA family transcriptional regulator [Bombilactobacillus bombi]AXX64413.1 helix-turn-helix domain-containing protein [Bombilactobacillus bombi]
MKKGSDKMGENTLGPIIKEIRKEKNLTQTELGKLTGYSQNTVSNYENQKRALSEKGISKYAAALGTTPQELFMRSQPNNQPHISVSYYTYYDLSDNYPKDVDHLTQSNVRHIALSSDFLGKYAGDKNIFITRVNSETMNKIIPKKSLIAVKKIKNWHELANGDIIIFQNDNGFGIRNYYYDSKTQIISFRPNSFNNLIDELNYRIKQTQNIKILGKVLTYTVNL